MSRNRMCICAALAAAFVFIGVQCSFADYIGTSYGIGGKPGTGGPTRIRDNGTVVSTNYTSTVPLSIQNALETYDAGVALTPDLAKLYTLVNTLGFSNYVIAADTSTGQFRAADTFALSQQFPPLSGDNNYIGVSGIVQPLIAGDELFTLSRANFPGGGPENWQIKRFDLATHALLEVINPPTTQHLQDIAVDPLTSRLYASGTAGIYSFNRTFSFTPPSSFGFVYGTTPQLLIPGVSGNLAIGPGLLYVKNSANGDIQRYTTSGAFIDTFISHNAYPNLGTIQFGVDGNLHVYQGGSGFPPASNILKFSGINGNLLSSTPNSYLTNQRITFVPVPEPASWLVLVIGAAVCSCSRRTTARPQVT